MTRKNNVKGILILESDFPELSHFGVPKHQLLVYGKPLLDHSIGYFLERQVGDLTIIGTDADASEARGNLKVTSELELRFVSVAKEENINEALANLLDDRTDEGVIVMHCGLIFEENPLHLISLSGGIEILVDKVDVRNKFADARFYLETNMWGPQKLGIGKGDSASCLLPGVYGFSPRMSREIATLMKKDGISLVTAVNTSTARSNVITRQVTKTFWYDVNHPDTLMRAELLMRAKHAGSRLSDVQVEDLLPLETDVSFTYSSLKTTPVVIKAGILNQIEQFAIMPPDATASRHFLITDELTDKLFADKVMNALTKAGYSISKLVVPIGEEAKQLHVYNELAERIVGMGVIDENTQLISLGGGAVANLTGFLASTLYRGVGLIHIPTTLMCMLDVAISLKQGINSQKKKNLIGSYYQPNLVLIDPAIPMSEGIVRNGMSEAIKHALCQDTDFFEYLVSYKGDIQDPVFIERVIKRTIELKVALMEDDMHENGVGLALQYGHEIGHALEYLSHLKLSHGEAISIGMRVSAEIAHAMGVTSMDTVSQHKEIFSHFELPYSIPKDISFDAIIDALRFNKKTRGKDIIFALLEFVGKMWKVKGEYAIPVQMPVLVEALKRSYIV